MNDYFEREANGTRDKILCSAAKLIGSKGYAKVSVRDIAEDAGVSLGQILSFQEQGRSFYRNSREAHAVVF